MINPIEQCEVSSSFVSITAPAMHVCSVCGYAEREYGYAKDEFWLCPDCLEKLKKLLDKSTES